VLLEKERVGDGSSLRAAGITTGLLWNEIGVRARQVGIQLFRQLSEELDGYTYHNEQGCLNLFEPHAWSERRKLLPLYERLGTEFQVLDASEIHRRWPALEPPEDFIGLWDPVGGYSEPEEYVPALAARIRQLGGEVREGQTVIRFATRGQSVTGVVTPDETIEADAVVSAVHAWWPPLWQQLDLRFPIKMFVHQRYVSQPVTQTWTAPPVNVDEYGGYFRPALGNRILLGAETADRAEHRVDSLGFRMNELQTPLAVRDAAVQRFAPYFSALRDAKWESEHIGLLAFSADGDPIVGPVERWPGLFVGAAFHSGGFSYNTVAGLLLAEFVVHGAPSIDVSAFSPGRFGAQDEINRYLDSTVAQSGAVRRRH